MGQVEAIMTVNAPIEAVWHSLNDIDHTPEWVVGLEDAAVTTSGPYGVDTVYNDYNRLGPVLQVTPWTITVFEPMSRQVHESKSSFLPSKMILNLAPQAVGTRVQMIVEYQFLPRLGLIGRALEKLLMNHVLKGVLTQNLSNLNSYLAGKTS
jgi:uncharacterized protein YndB with AHSA1/START domain